MDSHLAHIEAVVRLQITFILHIVLNFGCNTQVGSHVKVAIQWSLQAVSVLLLRDLHYRKILGQMKFQNNLAQRREHCDLVTLSTLCLTNDLTTVELFMFRSEI